MMPSSLSRVFMERRVRQGSPRVGSVGGQSHLGARADVATRLQAQVGCHCKGHRGQDRCHGQAALHASHGVCCHHPVRVCLPVRLCLPAGVWMRVKPSRGALWMRVTPSRGALWMKHKGPSMRRVRPRVASAGSPSCWTTTASNGSRRPGLGMACTRGSAGGGVRPLGSQPLAGTTPEPLRRRMRCQRPETHHR